ncbi:hypothetical protein WSM22_28480 [Cytophagales bacterium WSM2-2]|nr:hypothetical protein WSM22_28480 [Cytophagales bacterium WSM2-2]
MIYYTIAVFALSAVMGLIVALSIFNKKPETPKPVVYAHGILSAAGLLMLLLYMLDHPDNYPKVSLILFVVAALGGFYLFFNDMKKKPGPLGMVLIHAVIAVSAFVMLLVFALM